MNVLIAGAWYKVKTVHKGRVYMREQGEPAEITKQRELLEQEERRIDPHMPIIHPKEVIR